tara:strand:- start:1913 stop:2593 length:681 start_codon:yes stop_codon:yes gene_type:complete
MRDKLKDIIIGSYNKALSERKEFYLNGAMIQVVDPLTNSINLNQIVEFLKKKIPEYILSLVDVYYIGNFDVFKKKNTNAAYMDGAIYISNNQDSEKDLVDDIIHELGHALIEKDRVSIFSDGSISNEFMAKRKTLKNILTSEGYNVPRDFSKTSFSQEVDDFLFKEVGYEKIKSLINGLFMSPYSITSLEEYFTSGLEDYFLGKSLLLKTITPALYNKMEIYDVLD